MLQKKATTTRNLRRVKCDASRSSLGAALEQLTIDEWTTIAFTSRFLNSCNKRFGANELELLGVVWSIEYFKNYLYGKHFKVITDHRALLSILKENRSNKSYSSHLTCGIDKLLPFQFDTEHLPGAKMEIMDFISRHPSRKVKKFLPMMRNSLWQNKNLSLHQLIHSN